MKHNRENISPVPVVSFSLSIFLFFVSASGDNGVQRLRNADVPAIPYNKSQMWKWSLYIQNDFYIALRNSIRFRCGCGNSTHNIQKKIQCALAYCQLNAGYRILFGGWFLFSFCLHFFQSRSFSSRSLSLKERLPFLMASIHDSFLSDIIMFVLGYVWFAN